MWSGYPKMFLEPDDTHNEPTWWDIIMTICPFLFFPTALLRLPIWIFKRKGDWPRARMLK